MEKPLEIEIKEYALVQLKSEYEYYFNTYSEKYAEEFRLGFFEIVEHIGRNYQTYSECRFLKTKGKLYRNIVWGNYLIVYKITKEAVQVLFVFHTKQHPLKLKKIRRIK